jgi:hypothetical protein
VAERVDHDATFTRHDVTAAIATASWAGIDATELDRLVGGVLAHPDLAPIGAETTRSSAGAEARYSRPASSTFGRRLELTEIVDTAGLSPYGDRDEHDDAGSTGEASPGDPPSRR